MGLTSGTTDVDAIRGWMTIPYLAENYEVPAEYIFQKLEIPGQENEKKSLSQLNRQYADGEKGEIVEAVKAAILKYQQESSSLSTPAHE
jgi:ribosomal protein L7Ae-like RNA K-turn-binding protein